MNNLPSNHFTDNDSEAEYVNTMIVPISSNDFRSHPIWRTYLTQPHTSVNRINAINNLRDNKSIATVQVRQRNLSTTKAIKDQVIKMPTISYALSKYCCLYK